MSTASSTGTGALSGGASGAAVGTAIMPGYGTAIGAGVGAVAGGIAGFFKGKSEEDAAKKKRRAWEKAQRLLAEARMKADMESKMLMRDAYTPANQMLMEMSGGKGGVDMGRMTDTSMYAPKPPQGKR